MSETFDPYHRWLGIPPQHQPPNHYRLLGLEPFESDREVVRDAVERQMAHVRSYQLGQYAAVSQRILNELAAAKACLLEPGRKAAYDEAIRRQLNGPVSVDGPQTDKTPRLDRRLVGLTAAGGALVLALAALGIFGMGRHAETPEPTPAKGAADEAAIGAALVGLPPLQEVVSPWNSSLRGKLTAVRTARSKTLRGLQERSWDALLLAAQRAANAGTVRGPADVPERLILTGRLSALRVSEGKSVVFVQGGAGGADDSGPVFGGRAEIAGDPIAPFAAVEFEGEQLALTMSDYSVGDAIRVAVRRWTSKKSESPPPTIPGMSGELRSVRFAPETAVAAGRSVVVPCWCFRGEGLEKAGKTETWIDAKLGRAGGGAEDAIRRSPGFLLRAGPTAKGTFGRLIAQWEGMAPAGQELVAYLRIPHTSEGTIRCAVHFGPEVRREEFRDYRPGSAVELAAMIDDPLREMSSSASAKGRPPETDAGAPDCKPCGCSCRCIAAEWAFDSGLTCHGAVRIDTVQMAVNLLIVWTLVLGLGTWVTGLG